jgi:hypothetical protein
MYPRDEDSFLLRNVGERLQDYAVPLPEQTK